MMSIILYLFIIQIICINNSSQVSITHFKQALDLTGYDESERPFRQENLPLNITVQLLFYSAGPMDEKNFLFDTGLYLRQWWQEPRLFRIIESLQENQTVIKASTLKHILWYPDTSIADTKKIVTFENAERTVLYKHSMIIYSSKRYEVTTKCNMDLTNYPMDKQICDVRLENFAYANEDIRLIWHNVPIVAHEKMVLDGYDILKVINISKTTQLHIGDGSNNFSHIIARFIVRRTTLYHIIRAYIPSIVLQIFAFGTFFIPDNAIPARMGMLVTIFLSNTFILHAVTEKTGKVSYVTPLQIFLLVNLSVIVCAFLEYVMILKSRNNVENKKPKKFKKKTNRNICNCERQLMDHHDVIMEMTDESSLHRRESSSDDEDKNLDSMEIIKKFMKDLLASQTQQKLNKKTHFYDKISQVFFPTFYFVFCLTYFTTYLNG